MQMKFQNETNKSYDIFTVRHVTCMSIQSVNLIQFKSNSNQHFVNKRYFSLVSVSSDQFSSALRDFYAKIFFVRQKSIQNCYEQTA